MSEYDRLRVMQKVVPAQYLHHIGYNFDHEDLVRLFGTPLQEWLNTEHADDWSYSAEELLSHVDTTALYCAEIQGRVSKHGLLLARLRGYESMILFEFKYQHGAYACMCHLIPWDEWSDTWQTTLNRDAQSWIIGVQGRINSIWYECWTPSSCS